MIPTPARRYTLAELMCVDDVADELGIQVRRVRALAERHGLGRIIGSTRILTPDDLAVLRGRRKSRGRPIINP